MVLVTCISNIDFWKAGNQPIMNQPGHEVRVVLVTLFPILIFGKLETSQ